MTSVYLNMYWHVRPFKNWALDGTWVKGTVVEYISPDIFFCFSYIFDQSMTMMRVISHWDRKSQSPLLFWLVVWLPFFIFPIQLGIIIPIDFHIFQRGGPTTNQPHFSPIRCCFLLGKKLIDPVLGASRCLCTWTVLKPRGRDSDWGFPNRGMEYQKWMVFVSGNPNLWMMTGGYFYDKTDTSIFRRFCKWGTSTIRNWRMFMQISFGW